MCKKITINMVTLMSTRLFQHSTKPNSGGPAVGCNVTQRNYSSVHQNTMVSHTLSPKILRTHPKNR